MNTLYNTFAAFALSLAGLLLGSCSPAKADEPSIEPPAAVEPDKPAQPEKPDQPDQPQEPANSHALDVARRLGMGWNLGNQMDAHISGVAAETAWGNPKATKALFDKLAAAGFATVRIPVTWLGHVGGAPDYKIDDAWLDRVAELVGYAEGAGLNAVVNIHHDGGDSKYWLDIKNAAKDISVNKNVKAQLAAMWRQIAERFSDKGDFLILESMNEIHDGGWGWGENRTDGGRQYETLNEWNQTFVDAVRAAGGNNATRYLAVPSYCTDPDYAVDGSMRLPRDSAKDRLIVAVHYYTPVDFSLNDKYSEWGHTGKNVADNSGEEYLLTKFKALKEKFIDNDVPVYIGETGCVRRADNRSELFRRYYMEYVVKAAREHGMAPVYWDNGYDGTGHEQSGLFNRTTGDFLNDDSRVLVELMVRAYTDSSPSYTLESVYNSAPK